MIRTTFRFTRALVVLVGVFAAVPWALLRYAGTPVPERVPDLVEAYRSLERTGVAAGTVIWWLALVVWLAWLRLVVALVVELVARLGRRPAPTVRVLGSSQRIASSLLASLLMVAGTVGAGRGALAAPAAPAPTSVDVVATSVVVPTGPSDRAEAPLAPVGQPGTWTVARNDSLWRIAEQALGDGTRWREVAAANLGREVAPGVIYTDPDQTIHPGWRLLVPADAPPESEFVAVGPPPDPSGHVLVLDLSAAAPPVAAEAESATSCESVPAVPPAGTTVDVEPLPPTVIPVTDPSAEVPAVAPAVLDAVPLATASVPAGRSVVPLGVGAATAVATAGVGVVVARRRQRLREALPAARLVLPPTAELVDLERTLRTASAEEQAARIDLAVRGAVDLLTELGRANAVVVVARRDGDLEFLLDRPVVAAAPFENLGPDRWRLPAAVPTSDVPGGRRFAPFPCPALVPLGRTADGEVLVDLEALGVLVIDGSPRHARAVLRSLVAGVGLSPLAAGQRLLTVGLEHGVAVRADTEAVDELDAAIEVAATVLGPLLGLLANGTTAAHVRARSSGEAWEPVVIAAAAERVPTELAREVVSLGTPAGRGLAIVTDAPGLVGACRHRLRECAETWVLEPFGMEVRPVGLTAEQTGRLAALLDTAGAEIPVEPRNGDGRSDIAAFVEPEWTFMVRTLGPPAVITADGRTVEFGRAKALELVAWIGRHRATATRTSARSGMWATEVTNGSFANVVSDARHSLEAAVAPTDGETWLARTLTEQLTLHAAVVTDVELLEARLRHARRQAPSAARATLAAGLARVAGPPFAGCPYLWADAEGFVSQDTLVVTDAAAELARLALEDGDLEAVMWATAVGLLALPGHEELVGLRMRAHAGRGDLAAVRKEWEGYERVVAADPFGDAEPSARLLQLRYELLGGQRRAG